VRGRSGLPADDEDLVFEERDDLETAPRKRVVQARKIDEAAYEPVADIARLNPQRDAGRFFAAVPDLGHGFEDDAKRRATGQRSLNAELKRSEATNARLC
jgi:hypothetical protein